MCDHSSIIKRALRLVRNPKDIIANAAISTTTRRAAFLIVGRIVAILRPSNLRVNGSGLAAAYQA